ncbi:uncharacterized protein F5147DRAFT_776689 [Suillus discolor]|uniref:DUF6533 domain-containing protein n=1 Tax=Suillus discolor TaxID=1912936 RepID=A0A9P7F1N5_9AGAM|nr:uncharacterized protein F5147DRAFT_776689 [Suillus discolor]KAG2101338.1 hypothetical protein F5147DRAFT_776689 [Suillus discolor]
MGSYVDLVELQHWQTVAFVEAASTAALLFDFCITFDSEVRLTWGRKWGITRIAFVISRYIPIGTVAMYLYYGVGSTHGETPNPGTYIVVIGTMNVLGVAAADGMLAARAHAFCGREKSILIAISFFSIVMVSAALTILYVAASKCGKSTCDASEAKQFLGILYILPMTYQLVSMALTVYKRFKFYRQENTPLVSTVYRDGMIYMLCIALASIVNCVGVMKLPPPYSNIFYSPQVVVYSVFASRIMFNLRATYESQDITITGPVTSSVVIARPIQTSSGVDGLELLDIRNV